MNTRLKSKSPNYRMIVNQAIGLLNVNSHSLLINQSKYLMNKKKHINKLLNGSECFTPME